MLASVSAGRGANVSAGRGANVSAGRGANMSAGRGANVSAGRGANVSAGRGANVSAGRGAGRGAGSGTNLTLVILEQPLRRNRSYYVNISHHVNTYHLLRPWSWGGDGEGPQATIPQPGFLPGRD